ncbi:alpha/beta hydrolase fold-3 domain-containing protein [Dothidotthia symphoricarpi CBS 119687]|uniref:Alpha/beta hydrolase fold-3 domain-containing protein n=1 Tax=Dothidotthia symphoricarpi CBS 119687 TaxID=1392245 RepID=A0A6A5ZY64_9PLEO|nr:alpha/beta hydrolase fold-3 domain-containing protein [Dothidotthia symphoricarpi CBS 119687]KAF2123965.1 alpha/beta hydrolase fold-3 domain-containing protein [Dothidotthia symphoricarpi CBS 119687]
MALVTTQPFKLIYLLAAIGFEFVRLPIFITKYLLSSGRQKAEWTFHQAIAVRILSSVLWHLARVQHPSVLPLDPGAEKERFVLVKPAKPDMYQGPLRSIQHVKPIEIGATWYPAPLSAASSTSNVKVILHIHGGAYVSGDGRTRATGFMASQFLKHTPATHVFCPQYRLSSLPASETSNPFPAALQDSLTGYLYLLHDLKIPAHSIILSGDSAGGNAAIALLRYIAEYGPDLAIPAPSAALLWSPWIDPSDTTASYVHNNPHYATDFLNPPFTQWGTSAFAGLAGPAILSSPYVTQKNKPFETKVPLFVSVGGAEILYFDVVQWVGHMQGAGNHVTLDVVEHAPHDVLAVGHFAGFAREASGAAKIAGEWVVERRA